MPFLQPTQDDVNDQIADRADDLSFGPNHLLSDWEGQDFDLESWEQATPTVASPDLISRACEPESSSGVSNFINAQSVVSQTSTHLPVMPWETGRRSQSSVMTILQQAVSVCQLKTLCIEVIANRTKLQVILALS